MGGPINQRCRSFTVTITNKVNGPFQLSALLNVGSATGVTVAPAAGYSTARTSARYVSLQSDPTNGASKVFKGDANTANDGSRQGKVLLAGDVDVEPTAHVEDVDLNSIYVNTDTNGAKINIEVHYA
jgi:hypothetical protein